MNIKMLEQRPMLHAWEELPYRGEECSVAWNYLYGDLSFRPNVSPESWPGIHEPHPSVTYAIGHIYTGDEVKATRLEEDLARKTLAAFRVCTRTNQRLYALDWQHYCYWFYPHRSFTADDLESWSVPILPNGDYFIFLNEDFSFGIFGHPWEQTMCVFGQRLLDAFAQEQPLLFRRVVRVNGMQLSSEELHD
jgi:hypothetical protein